MTTRTWIAALAAAGALGCSSRTGAPAPSPEVAAMIEAELAFARLNQSAGQRAAWLEYFALDGVMFRPEGPVNAREFMSGNPQPAPAPPGAFDWRPTYGAVALSNDLGYNAGPVRVGAAGSTSMFFSVWRKQPDGSWRVVVDLGMPVTFALDPFDDRYVTAPLVRPGGQPGTAADLARPESRPFPDFTGFLALLDVDVRGVRWREAPLVGREAFRLSGERFTGPWNFQTMGSGMSAAGDMGYTYGRYSLGEPAAQRGSYARVWRRDGSGAWRIVYDVALPDRPPPN